MTKNYKLFLNKVCTILTHPYTLPIQDARQHAEYFTGQVVDVNDEGILIRHLNAKTHALYSFPIIGIVEEQVVSRDNPNYDKIKEEVEKKKTPAIKPMSPNVSLSVEDMTKMAKQIKTSRPNTPQASSAT